MSFSINSFHSQIVIFNMALWGTLTRNRIKLFVSLCYATSRIVISFSSYLEEGYDYLHPLIEE